MIVSWDNKEKSLSFRTFFDLGIAKNEICDTIIVFWR